MDESRASRKDRCLVMQFDGQIVAATFASKFGNHYPTIPSVDLDELVRTSACSTSS